MNTTIKFQKRSVNYTWINLANRIVFLLKVKVCARNIFLDFSEAFDTTDRNFLTWNFWGTAIILFQYCSNKVCCRVIYQCISTVEHWVGVTLEGRFTVSLCFSLLATQRLTILRARCLPNPMPWLLPVLFYMGFTAMCCYAFFALQSFDDKTNTVCWFIPVILHFSRVDKCVSVGVFLSSEWHFWQMVCLLWLYFIFYITALIYYL